jgi:hypothetical protein
MAGWDAEITYDVERRGTVVAVWPRGGAVDADVRRVYLGG